MHVWQQESMAKEDYSSPGLIHVEFILTLQSRFMLGASSQSAISDFTYLTFI